MTLITETSKVLLEHGVVTLAPNWYPSLYDKQFPMVSKHSLISEDSILNGPRNPASVDVTFSWDLNIAMSSSELLLNDPLHDVIMAATASQITSIAIVYSTVYSSADQRKHQSSAPLAFLRGLHRWPVNSPLKWPVTRKMLPFHDIIVWLWRLCSLRSKSLTTRSLEM